MINTIEPQELKERIENGENPTIIDVREEWEYDESNLGATNIPLHALPHKISDLLAMKDEEIILHCKSGGRSTQAQKFLIKQGFTKTRNLVGGIEAYLACA